MSSEQDFPFTHINGTTLSQPWGIISVDLVGPLPNSNGHNAILNIVDHFFKMGIAVPT